MKLRIDARNSSIHFYLNLILMFDWHQNDLFSGLISLDLITLYMIDEVDLYRHGGLLNDHGGIVMWKLFASFYIECVFPGLVF